MLEELNYRKFKNIKKQLNLNELNSLSQTLFSLPKTKVYLVHEFDLQGRMQIVVIVRWWDGIRQSYSSKIYVWDKELAMKID